MTRPASPETPSPRALLAFDLGKGGSDGPATHRRRPEENHGDDQGAGQQGDQSASRTRGQSREGRGACPKRYRQGDGRGPRGHQRGEEITAMPEATDMSDEQSMRALPRDVPDYQARQAAHLRALAENATTRAVKA